MSCKCPEVNHGSLVMNTSPGSMVSTGCLAMKCPTPSAMELMCPGVPVTACASMRPRRSNTPAARSPASRTLVENAVRTSVCACSSTTEIRRFHMTCWWMVDSVAVGLMASFPFWKES